MTCVFHALKRVVGWDNGLSQEMKELLALCVALTQSREACVIHHTREAARLGAKRREILDVISVAREMADDSAVIADTMALAAFDENHKEAPTWFNPSLPFGGV